MSSKPDQVRRVTVELPAGTGTEGADDALADKLRTLWILDQVRVHAISSGRGAELAGLPLSDFLILMGQHGISMFDYDAAELSRELGVTSR